jgi:hypothetical protein
MSSNNDTNLQIQKKMKEKNGSFNSKKTNKEKEKENKYTGNIKPEVIEKLILFGFELDQIIITHKAHKFTDIEQACYLMLKDPETNLYNHIFIPKDEPFNEKDIKNLKKIYKDNSFIENIESNKCKICKGILSEHIIYENLNLDTIINKTDLNININNNNNKTDIGNYFNKDPFHIIDTNNNFDKENINDNNINNYINDNNNIVKNKEKENKENKENKEKRFSINNNNTNKVSNKALKFSVIYKKISERRISDISQNPNYHQINNTSISTKFLNNNINNSFINLNLDIKNNNSIIENKSIDLNKTNLIKKSQNENIDINLEKEIDRLKNYESKITILNNDDKKIKKKIYSNYIIPNEIIEYFSYPDLCKICYTNKINEKNKVLFDCGHFFCCNCVTNYLTLKINNGKVIYHIKKI